MFRAELQQPVGYFGLPEPAIEAIGKFIEVFLQVAVADAMIGSEQEALEITDHDMDPGQPLVGAFRRRDLAGVMILFAQNVERHQRIGSDGDLRSDSPMGEVAYPLMVYGGTCNRVPAVTEVWRPQRVHS